MVCAGAVGGIVLGVASARYMETLLYQVKPSDLGMLALPAGTLVGTALLAAAPAILRAVRIDPVEMLRAE